MPALKEEKYSRIGWESVRNKYRAPMKRAMHALYVDMRENLPALNAQEPFEMDCDNYSVVIRCEPSDRETFDISFQIMESVDFEGIQGGFTFRIDVVEDGGRMLGECSPYNYTEKVWCKTHAEIAERYRLCENALDDMTAYLADEVLQESL